MADLQILKATILLIILLFPAFCMAQPLPDEITPSDIVILESEHFTVRYPKSAEVYARKTVDYAEYAYGILSDKLESDEDDIIIQLFDRVDVYLDYPAIDIENLFTIYLWPPNHILEYPYYENWLEEQISSHIARILIQNTRSDIGHLLQNFLLPVWYLDGLSNLYTFPENPGLPKHHGIIRAIVRSAARDHALPELGHIMSGYRTWLDNSINEIYGSVFLNYIASVYGFEKLTEFNVLNGSNFSTIESNAEEIFGKSWSDLYREWTEKEHDSNPPLYRDKQSLSEPWLHEKPQIVPGQNDISYVRDDGVKPKAIVLHNLETHQKKTIIECSGQCLHHWSDDGKTLYYTTNIKTSYFESETLYALESDSHFPRKLPIPGHIRTFTESNGFIIAVTILNDQPQIYKLDTLENDHAELLYTAPAYSLIEGMTAIDQDRWIASYYDPSKKQFDLILITDKHSITDIHKITDNPETEMYPFIMQNNTLGYVTESDGYYMLNRISLDGLNHDILYTHDVAMIEPVQSPDGTIYFTDISHKGMAIAAVNLPQPNDEYIKSVIEKSPAWYDDVINGHSDFSIPSSNAEYDDTFDWSVFIPDLILPALGTSDTAGWYLGVSLANSDELNYHLYDIYFAWFFNNNVFDLNLTYQYTRYSWKITVNTGVKQDTYLVDTGKDYKLYPLTTYWASLKTGTEFHFPLLDMELSFELLAEHTKTSDHSMDDLIAQWMDNIEDKNIDMHRRWTNAMIGNLKLSHTHDAPMTLPGETGYSMEYQIRFEPPFLSNYTYSVANSLRLNMVWSMPWRALDAFSILLFYGVAVTGKPYRYPLELDTGSGFDFNYFGLDELVDFHGIRSGNLLANNHLIYGHIEYTIPVYIFRNNILKIPLMLNRIGLGLVGDWGVKSDDIDQIDFSDSLFGVGAELYLDMTVLYRYNVRMKFGYERGFSKAGENAYYLWIGFL